MYTVIHGTVGVYYVNYAYSEESTYEYFLTC